MLRNTKLQINVDNYINNSKAFIAHTNKKMMGIIKANAYGLNDAVMGKFLEESGVDFFGVATLDEALNLRKGGIKSEILVLSYVHDLDICLKNNFSIIVPNVHFVEENKDKLKGIKVHIKVNTGLNRLGLFPKEVKETLDALLNAGAIVEGIMTHFACTDNKEYTQKQYDLFKETVKACNYDFKFIHTSATDAAIYLNDDICNYIRIGLGLLGTANIDFDLPLKNVVTLSAEVIDCKQLEKGEGVSYHHNYVADGNGYYLTCTIGYADGMDLRYSGKEVYVDGEIGTIVGNVCMDLMVVKTNKPHSIGSQVEIIGEHMPIQKRVKDLSINACKVVTDISDRITRVYIKDGKVVLEKNQRFNY